MSKSALFTVRKQDPCPACGADLVIRSGKHGAFLGCSNYPACDYIRPLKNQADGHIVKVLEGRSRYGKTFHACNRYPACQFAVNATPVAGICPHCAFPLLVEKKTAQGVKRFCASKSCGKAAASEN